MDEYGQLSALEGETEFSHIPDWSNWERECVREEIKNGMYYFEDEVVRACRETGMRGYLGETIIGQSTCDAKGKPYGGFEIAELGKA